MTWLSGLLKCATAGRERITSWVQSFEYVFNGFVSSLNVIFCRYVHELCGGTSLRILPCGIRDIVNHHDVLPVRVGNKP